MASNKARTQATSYVLVLNTNINKLLQLCSLQYEVSLTDTNDVRDYTEL